MPPRRKIQNYETPESRVEEIEVRWLADSPSVPHRPHEVVKLPLDDHTRDYLRMKWCERTQ